MSSTYKDGVDNSPGVLVAKVEIRRAVLAALPEAHVFDAFCGRGEMYRHAWREAASYAGCDERPWSVADEVSRYVADNRRVLRCLDLSHFNVFDCDAYGSPWEQLMIIARRRRWAPGERGAVVITDGLSINLRLSGKLPHVVALLLGESSRGAWGAAAADLICDRCEAAWLRLSGLRLVKAWRAKGRGGAQMRYSSLLVEGAPKSEG